MPLDIAPCPHIEEDRGLLPTTLDGGCGGLRARGLIKICKPSTPQRSTPIKASCNLEIKTPKCFTSPLLKKSNPQKFPCKLIINHDPTCLPTHLKKKQKETVFPNDSGLFYQDTALATRQK